jgi:hypothetical protein
MFTTFIIRLHLIAAAIICLSLALPILFAMAAKKRDNTPYITFSAVIKDFIIASHGEESRYQDTYGNIYTLREYERLMPFVFTKDLLKWGEYPEEIGGVHIPPQKAETDWDTVTVSPSAAHAAKTRLRLFPLFESDSGFSSIPLPDDLFRIDNRMEFINAAGNTVNEEKSTLFTNAIAAAGFSFPAKMISGNPTNHNPYDFGYFIMDSKNEIFRVFQAKAQPMVEKTGISGDGVFFMKVKENPYLPYYGLLIADIGKAYLILKDDYRLQELWLEDYNPRSERLVFTLDPLYMTVKVINENGERLFASTREGEAVKQYSYQYERRLKYAALYDAVFPFIINPNPSKRDGFWSITLSRTPAHALAFSLAIAALYTLFISYRYKIGWKMRAFDFILIALFGLYALIAIILEGFGSKYIIQQF